jgi:hypothetical protein
MMNLHFKSPKVQKVGTRYFLAEIKSTLDLVFEKTKNLTLSDEEKLSLAREKLEKKVQGLCNRYLDNFFPLNRLKDEMETIASSDPKRAYNFFKEHLLSRFDLDSDNSLIISALSEIAKFDIISLKKVQEKYNSEKEETKKAFTEKFLLDLKDRGVSGSAVRVNLDTIPEWNESLKTLRKRYQEQIQTRESNY